MCHDNSLRNHRARALHSAFLIVAILIVAAILSACASAPAGAERDPSPTLSWAGDPATTMTLSWFGVAGVSGVEFRPAGGSQKTQAAVVDGPVTRVTLSELNPGSEYEYRAVIDGNPSSWRSFSTPPAAGSLPRGGVLRFAVAGDLQPFNEETIRTTSNGIRKVASLDPAFILQVGDVAEVGILRGSWETAASVLGEANGEVPFVATAGNHDYYYGLPSARNFKTFFPAPYAGGDDLKRNTWYSMTVGPVHIAVLDTEADGDRFDEQLSWLEKDLQSAAGDGIEWTFISMHRPILASATGSEDQRWARALFPVIAEHDVDAVFWGHDHMYEHYEYQYGANGYVFDPDDTVASEPTHYFTAGTIGARVDVLYAGFFTHKPFAELWEMYDLASGAPVELEFFQRPWNVEHVKRDGAGVRYQDPSAYPDAGSWYSYPFDSASDAEAGRYSDDPARRYSDDAEFFGYTYGETSIHYLWVEVTEDECVITAHYADGAAGRQGTVITTPDGAPQRWVLN